ncbi:MAG: ABC transporter permease [Chloroflexi bacterium]|nr:ABC transporter permease [Chloroflexota bacterium]
MSSAAVVVESNGLARRQRIERFWNLLGALVARDIRARYRRSALGPAWAILQPLVLMVLFNMIRGFVDIPSDGVPYIIFSFSALVPWTFFGNAVMFCGPSIFSNAGIVKKIAVEREVFPAAAVVTALFDLAMSGLVLAAMMLWFQVPIGWSVLWLPVLVLLTGLLALGVGMGIAALGTFKRDFIMASPFLMQFWLYATPIIYPLSSVPERWRPFYVLNPMVGIIEAYRAVLVKGIAPDLGLLAWSLVGIAVVWAVAWPLFRAVSQYFADVL